MPHKHRNTMAEPLDLDVPHREPNTWRFSLFQCHNRHRYLCACVCPCVPINTVRRLIWEQDSSDSNMDVESSAAAVGSVVFADAPCLVGAMVFNHRLENWIRSCGSKGDNECCGSRGDDDEPASQWQEWQAYAHDHLSDHMAALACLVYPAIVCPTTWALRRYAVDRKDIDNEGCLKSAEIACCCGPCALVQMEDELEGDDYIGKGLRRSLRR